MHIAGCHLSNKPKKQFCACTVGKTMMRIKVMIENRVMRSFVVSSHGPGRNYSHNLVVRSGIDPKEWS